MSTDDLTPEPPLEAAPEQDETPTEYSWRALPADDSRPWNGAAAPPVEPPTWSGPEPRALGGLARPAWTPAVWEPASPASLPGHPEHVSSQPPPPPAPLSAPAPPVEEPSPPAPVEEAPADPEPAPAAPKTSLLKKEISFRRKPKAAKPAKEPKAAKPPKPEKAPKAKKRERAPKAESGKASLLKREISFRRKPKAGKAPTQPKAKEPKGGSFLKRDISLGRKRTAAPKPAAAPKARRGGKAKPTAKAHKKLVGLKIGASQIAAARVLNNGSAQLVQIARGPLAPGVVVGGEVRDPDRLAEALKEFFAQNKLPKRGVRLGLANNRIGVRVFELEGIDDPRQLTNAIRFRSQEALPIPVDEAVLDYEVLDERLDEEGHTVRRILLVVAYRELIERYVAACRKAGIQLVGIDLEAFALLRALSPAVQPEDAPSEAAVVAVSIGSDRSTFAVSNGSVCEFTRVLEWGGISLDVAVARALDISPSQAEPFKRGLGLETSGTPEGLSAEQAATAREAIRGEVQAFARELVSSLQFYQNQPGSLGIAEIALTGGTAHLKGLADQLEKLIGVRVRLADPLAHVRVGKRVKADQQLGSLTVAIGLGVER